MSKVPVEEVAKRSAKYDVDYITYVLVRWGSQVGEEELTPEIPPAPARAEKPARPFKRGYLRQFGRAKIPHNTPTASKHDQEEES